MEKRLKRVRRVRRILISIFCAAAALVILFGFVLGFATVSGRSMMDSYRDGDVVLYVRLGKPDRGDVVNIRVPGGEFYVKRVLGVGGDVIDLKDGVLYVNGEAENGSCIKGVTLPEGTAVRYPYTVPEGCLFVVGDNREESVDSRSFGALPEKNVKGTIRITLF